MAASLARLARSAPEKPGVPRATTFRSTSGPSCLPRQCTARIAARSVSVGSGIVTCRSNRPGRSSAGSRTSGRLVAARTTMPWVMSKPSISDSSWFSVCSRSSLETTAPEPARRWPMASISSTKMIAGRPLARLGEQVTDPGRADADEQLDEARAGDREERHRCLAGHGPGQQRLAGARRADHQHAARRHRAGPLVALRLAQEVDHLADLGLGALVAGDVAELGLGRSASKTLARLRPTPSTPCSAALPRRRGPSAGTERTRG